MGGFGMLNGTLVNTGAVLLGSCIGLLLKKGIPTKQQKTVMQGLGLAVLVIGIQMAFKGQNPLVTIISLVIGGIIGETIGIQNWLDRFGVWMNSKLGEKHGNVGQGFITASLVFCIGAMAIVGAIQDGLTGNASTLYAKSMIDGIASIVFASTMGIGVVFASISVLIYQGSISLLASLLTGILTAGVISEITAVGGVLIIGLSMLMLEIKEINVANLIPAIPVAIVVASIWPS